MTVKYQIFHFLFISRTFLIIQGQSLDISRLLKFMDYSWISRIVAGCLPSGVVNLSELICLLFKIQHDDCLSSEPSSILRKHWWPFGLEVAVNYSMVKENLSRCELIKKISLYSPCTIILVWKCDVDSYQHCRHKQQIIGWGRGTQTNMVSYAISLPLPKETCSLASHLLTPSWNCWKKVKCSIWTPS